MENSQESVQKSFDEVIEAYKMLLEFQKWTYDTYQRDARLFLTIEVVVLGLVASSLSGGSTNSLLSLLMIAIATGFGIFLTVAWASRQQREFYMSKGRLNRLRELEESLPESFRYFSTTYRKSREDCEAVSWLPVLGKRMCLLPHIYRNQAFLRSLILQQAFLFLWFIVGGFVIIKLISS
ncbi:hypothetical protein [uncultured Gimesia sp.]|uniref:RipA family octameric membrane protein n=1 Tax=uncultured Gimesia sp. TaxID=1678688 RepID=UPI0030D8D123|tara:strand:+ start:34861 stop:35400 length:540 start_codon:yes stop_codon:yes gene_type:complete